MSWLRNRFGQSKKYGNKKVVEDGKKFDSLDERNRYLLLKERARRGEIFNLTLKPKFPLDVNGVPILERPFRPDFCYTTRDIDPGFNFTSASEVAAFFFSKDVRGSEVSFRDVLTDCLVVEDVKGYMDSGDDGTKLIKIKAQLLLAVYGVELTIVQTEKAIRSQERRKARRSVRDRDRRILRKLSEEGRNKT